MLTFKHPSKPYVLSAQYAIVNEHVTIQWQLLNTQTCLVEKNGSLSFPENDSRPEISLSIWDLIIPLLQKTNRKEVNMWIAT